VSFVETKEQLALQEQARDVVARVVTPVAASVPAGQKLTPDHLRRIYKALEPLGYLGSTIPREFGGAGLSYVDYGLLLEALAAGPVVLGEIVPPRTINYLGSEAQKRRWLPKLFSGDWVSTAAITEPQAGSDMRGFTTSDRQAAGRSRTGRWFAPSTRRPRPEREGTCRKS
jgi:alkylation response protein AidB-like acyl-CoA dehydrogenase